MQERTDNKHAWWIPCFHNSLLYHKSQWDSNISHYVLVRIHNFFFRKPTHHDAETSGLIAGAAEYRGLTNHENLTCARKNTFLDIADFKNEKHLLHSALENDRIWVGCIVGPHAVRASRLRGPDLVAGVWRPAHDVQGGMERWVGRHINRRVQVSVAGRSCFSATTFSKFSLLHKIILIIDVIQL